MAVEKAQSPRVMKIFEMMTWPENVPKDVPLDELTPEQQKLVRDAYRFGGYKPGMYQGITGIEGTI